MSNMLKCPRPTCPYIFDPSQVPVGVVLSCPRCGMQFTLGPPAPAAAPPPGYPPAPGYPSAPAEPAPETVHPEFEAVGRTALEERDPDEPRPGRRTNKAQVFILAGIASVLMAGTALAIIFKLMHRSEAVPAATVSLLQELNVGVDTPPSGWKRDDSMRVKVGSPYVLSYKRENPEAYMAFGANTPPVKGRSPRPTEMTADMTRAFARLFDSVQPKSDPIDPTWLGETIAPEHGFAFRAQSTDGLSWAGEVYTVAHKGIAYFWLSWCLENDYDAVKSEFAAFRGKFQLLRMREDWKETRSNVNDFKGDKVPYTISDAEELWKEVSAEEFPALKAVEPDLDRRLRMTLTPKHDRKGQAHTAELSVYVIEDSGDALESARKYAQDIENARIAQANVGREEPLPPPTFKERTGNPEGDPVPTTVPATAPYLRLESRVKDAKGQARLIVVSARKVSDPTLGDKTVVVHCWCPLGEAKSFETKFVQIASSLR